jgi:hypothetical protein
MLVSHDPVVVPAEEPGGEMIAAGLADGGRDTSWLAKRRGLGDRRACGAALATR